VGDSLQELKSAASGLPESDRAELARFLIRSLDDGDDDGAAAEWLVVAEARMAEVRAGSVVGVPAAEVLRGLPGGRPW